MISRLSETAAGGSHPGACSPRFCGSHPSGLQEREGEGVNARGGRKGARALGEWRGWKHSPRK